MVNLRAVIVIQFSQLYMEDTRVEIDSNRRALR